MCRTASLRVIIVNNYTLVASDNMNLTSVVARIIKGSRKLFNKLFNFIRLKFELFRSLTKWPFYPDPWTKQTPIFSVKYMDHIQKNIID
jgi:hypothetical protein